MLQIVRADIVVPLSEYRPPPELAATVRTQPVPRVEKDAIRERGVHEDGGGGASGQHAPRQGGGALRAYADVAHPPQEPVPAVVAGQIMTPEPVTLPLDARPEAARAIFRERHFLHLPLLDAEGRIAGVLSEHDLLRAAIRRPRAALRLGEIGTREVLTATADTPVRDIAAAMLEHHFSCVPVIDAARRPVGIVTRSDILRALVRRAPLELWA